MRRIRGKYGLVSIALLVVAACGGGGAAATVGPSAPPAVIEPFVTPRPDEVAASLCAAFDETLATAALNEPVNAPDSGDVLPRPNGVYCHYAATENANHNVEAQLKDMTREEFDDFAETLHAEEELSNVGEAAYKIEGSLIGGTGAFVMAFAGDRGVTVNINDDGDQAAMNQVAIDIALAALAS